MSEDDVAESQKPATKKVVKRVVKKAPAASPTRPAPAMRYGRPVKQASDVDATAGTKKPAKKAPSKKAAATSPTKASVPVGAGVAPDIIGPDMIEPEPIEITEVEPSTESTTRPRADARELWWRLRDAAAEVGSTVRDRFADVRDLVADRIDDAREVRAPVINPVPAAWGTGVVVGLLSVLLGWGALQMFAILRGVSSGGGTWGTLTFVVVGFLAFAVGERMLAAFGVALPRMTSGLGVLFTVTGMLVFFIDTADSWMAVFIVPALAAVAYTAAQWLMAAAQEEDAVDA